MPNLPVNFDQDKFLEQFSLNVLPVIRESTKNELSNESEVFIENSSQFFTEAVFKDGKSTMKPIEEQFQIIKDLLDKELSQNQSKNDTKFDPDKFVKNLVWKELEDRMIKIFGFRNIEILHLNEKYRSATKDFESMELNCFTSCNWRYPIDGLVTDKGLYDSTRSINTRIIYTLGLLKKLSAAEITAVFLHELGHNIDPALVDINYVKTNVLSKYLTDRESSISDKDKKVIGESEMKFTEVLFQIILLAGVTFITFIPTIIRFIRNKLFNPKKAEDQIRAMIQNDKSKFTRQTNPEAFADNFARMYGYGPQLMSAFGKIERNIDKVLGSRIKKEKERQKIIADMTISAIQGSHKTDIHRARSLIKEYESDLKDSKIPEKIKKDIREDLEEFKKVFDKYMNSSNEFSNNINKIILEELEKSDASITDEAPTPES